LCAHILVGLLQDFCVPYPALAPSRMHRVKWRS
jgi:hypothetical protein